MRVIAGKARRLVLKTIDGSGTRPTTDRIKETLFNMLQYDLADALFVDLFSGSGAIGIEALSRGAKYAWFVENNPKACACIRENLAHTGLEAQARVMMQTAQSAVKSLSRETGPVDFIFMDPPYGRGLALEVLTALKSLTLADAHTTIIIEADRTEDFSCVQTLGYEILREKVYTTNKHVFLIKNES